MADDRNRVKIWYDPEGDYLEVIFDQKPGYFRETESDQVMEKVDAIQRLVFMARVEEGLAQLDAGQGISHEEIKRRFGA